MSAFRRVGGWLVLLTVLALVGGVGGLWLYSAPYRALGDWKDTAINELQAHEDSPPDNVDPEEWRTSIAWTCQAIGNCYFTPNSIRDWERFRTFKAELSKKLSRRIEVETLHWIWDETKELTTWGAEYSRKYRKFVVAREAESRD